MSENKTSCAICNNSTKRFAWTDTHGVAQCWVCGIPYQFYFYEKDESGKDRRVEKPPEIYIKPGYIPYAKQYWEKFKRRMPSECSFPGGYELATREDMESFYSWWDENVPKDL